MVHCLRTRRLHVRIQIGYGRQPRAFPIGGSAKGRVLASRARFTLSLNIRRVYLGGLRGENSLRVAPFLHGGFVFGEERGFDLEVLGGFGCGGGDVRRVRVQGRIGGGGVAEVRL